MATTQSVAESLQGLVQGLVLNTPRECVTHLLKSPFATREAAHPSMDDGAGDSFQFVHVPLAPLDENKTPNTTESPSHQSQPPTPPFAASANAAAALLSIAALPTLKEAVEDKSSSISPGQFSKAIPLLTEDGMMEDDWVVVNCGSDGVSTLEIGLAVPVESSHMTPAPASLPLGLFSPFSPSSSPSSSPGRSPSHSPSSLQASWSSSLASEAELCSLRVAPGEEHLLAQQLGLGPQMLEVLAPEEARLPLAAGPNALEVLAGVEVQAERLPETPLPRTVAPRESKSTRKRKSKETSPTLKRCKQSPPPRYVHEPEPALAEGAAAAPKAEGAEAAEDGDADVPTIGIYTKAQRAEKIRRYREKKKKRKFKKKVLYHCRKAFADRRPRVGGRFVSATKLPKAEA